MSSARLLPNLEYECECGARLKRPPTSSHLGGGWHSGGLKTKREALAFAALEEHGWTRIPIHIPYGTQHDLAREFTRPVCSIAKTLKDPRLEPICATYVECIPTEAIALCQSVGLVLQKKCERLEQAAKNLIKAALAKKLSPRRSKLLEKTLAQAMEIQLRAEAGKRR